MTFFNNNLLVQRNILVIRIWNSDLSLLAIEQKVAGVAHFRINRDEKE